MRYSVEVPKEREAAIVARFFKTPYAFTLVSQCPTEGVVLEILAWIAGREAGSITVVRCGDFYETYLEDAILLAEIEGLVVTSKSAGESGRIPLCGFPYFSLDRHTRQLAVAGIVLRFLPN